MSNSENTNSAPVSSNALQQVDNAINSVNIQTYTNKLTVDELTERVGAAQEKLVGIIGSSWLSKDKMLF